MNRRWRFLALLALLAAIDSALLIFPAKFSGSRGDAQANSRLVRALGLTDLAIWTEARYTRHPTQTDFFSPFQDLPGGMEHFPAGALISPPAHLLESGAGRGHPGEG